jgi:hypothetical protein
MKNIERVSKSPEYAYKTTHLVRLKIYSVRLIRHTENYFPS